MSVRERNETTKVRVEGSAVSSDLVFINIHRIGERWTRVTSGSRSTVTD